MSIDGMTMPSLQSMRQSSAGAMDKAKLMVGLKQQSDVESQQSERSGIMAEMSDLLCPALTFQQRLIGFFSCFTVGCR
jgi:hypothetical protein